MTDTWLWLLAGLVGVARLLWPPSAARRLDSHAVDLRIQAECAGGGHPVRPGLRHDRAPGRGAARGSTVDEVADALVLLALALRGGRSPLDALEDVAARVDGEVARDLATVAAFHRWGLDGDEAWSAVPDVWGPAAVAWVAAERAGVSPGPLLDRAAASIRSRAAAEREAALQRAAVLLVLPLGVAFLPGFVLTTVAPTIWRLLPSLLGS